MPAAGFRRPRRTAAPPVPGRLVGRGPELESLCARLADPDVRLVTLTGPPGVGKTRLATAAAAAVAEEFADAPAFVDLTTIRDPGDVAGEVADALGAGARGVDQVPVVLGDRRLLLVLDNFEHVLPAATGLGDLLAACPGLTVLVTSRERLRLRLEREVPVPPLSLPDTADGADPERLAASPAVALLVERVQAFDPSFAVTAANGPVLAEICVRLDGLPLALELAAPRLRMFTAAELTVRLRNRLRVLTSDARDAPDRHRTLHAALAWSHGLLTDEERAVFRRLSVFVGGWTVDAAREVTAAEDADAVIASLTDKSLIRRETGSGEVARFGMLESLREFAADLLERAGETAATADRHAAWFRALGDRADDDVGTVDERSTIEDLGTDVGNVRAALRHAETTGRLDLALPLATAIGWYSYTRGQLGSGQAVLDEAVGRVIAAGEPPGDALAGALLISGVIALGRGDLDRADERLHRSLEISHGVGAQHRTAVATAFLGHLARVRGRTTEAVEHHERAGRLHGELADVFGVAWSRYDLGPARPLAAPPRTGGGAPGPGAGRLPPPGLPVGGRAAARGRWRRWSWNATGCPRPLPC